MPPIARILLVAAELYGPIRALIEAAVASNEEEAKRAHVDLMLAGKKVALRKLRGG